MSNDRADLEQILSRAFGRDMAFMDARTEQMTSGVEEYWPDMAGLEYRDTVTDFELPAGTFFDIAVLHLPGNLLATSPINRLRELYPQGRFEARRFRPTSSYRPAARIPLRGERLDRPHGRHWRHCSPGHHRTMPALRDDHAAGGDLPKDSGILRTAAQLNGVNVGVYASVSMAGPSAAATRSCSPELGLTRRPCRGLLEAALLHVAAFQEIRRRRDSPSRPRSRAPARPGRPRRRQRGGTPGVPVAEEKTQDAHRAKRQRVYRVRGLT